MNYHGGSYETTTMYEFNGYKGKRVRFCWVSAISAKLNSQWNRFNCLTRNHSLLCVRQRFRLTDTLTHVASALSTVSLGIFACSPIFDIEHFGYWEFLACFERFFSWDYFPNALPPVGSDLAFTHVKVGNALCVNKMRPFVMVNTGTRDDEE